MSELTFDKRASKVKTLVLASEGKVPSTLDYSKEDLQAELKTLNMGKEKDLKENQHALKASILTDFTAAQREMDSLRAGSKDRRAVDISLGAYIQERWGFAQSDNGTPESFYQAIGLNASYHTMDSLLTMPEFDSGYRWLIPEIIREAVRLGLRRQPIYPSMIVTEETVSQPTVTLPWINLSDAMPRKIGESETIPTGAVSFGQKSVSLQKVGTGLKLTDEIIQYVSLNILSIYLEDVGVKMGLALDALMIDTLINGDGNGNAAPVIGVDTVNQWSYKDLLRAWIRMGLLGRLPQGIISNEDPALEILSLPEFKGYGTGIGPVSGNQIPAVPSMNLRTPVPTSQNYDIHGAMPATNQIMLVDNRSSLIKLNSSALRVESARIAERQITGTYVSMTTGFAKLFDDATLIIDKSLAFSSQGFPAWMNAYSQQTQTFKS